MTGLVVQDTALYWSGFGQAVILMLIQIGGMGVVTAAAAISMLAGRRIGLKERWVMQESISAPQVGGHRSPDPLHSGGDAGPGGDGDAAAGSAVLPGDGAVPGTLVRGVSCGVLLLQRRVRPDGGGGHALRLP